MFKYSNLWSALAAALLALAIVNPAWAATLTWTGTASLNWNTTDSNWGGPLWNNATPDTAIFGATGVGTVSLTTAITANTITFNTIGYTLTNNTLTLGGTAPALTNNADATIGSRIAGTAGFTKQGTGTLTLTASNTFTGNVTHNAGTLKLTHSNALGTGTKNFYMQGTGRVLQLSGGITLGNNFTLQLSSNSGDAGGLYSVDGTNTILGNILFTSGNPALNISSAAGSQLTISGNITLNTTSRTLYFGGTSINANTVNGMIGSSSGVLPVTKQGTGTWVFDGANTYTGDTTVNGGKLIISGSLQSSNLNVAAATLAPQGAPFTAGNLSLAAGSAFQVRVLPSLADRLTVGGTVTLAGNLELIPPPGMVSGNSFVILNKTNAGAISGTFAGLPEGALFTVGGYNWRITYVGGDGNDVVVTLNPGLPQSFEGRRTQVLEALRGQPYVPGYVSPDLTYRRPQSYEQADFAFRCFLNNEQNKAANDSLAAFCNLYADGQAYDNIDWMSDMLFSMIENFGSSGRIAPGRLSPAVEDALLALLWSYAKQASIIARTDTSVTNIVWSYTNGTENLVAMNLYTMWHAAKIFRNHPTYSGLAYNDGSTPQSYYLSSTAYCKEWLRDHARKGGLVEFSNDFYNPMTIKGVYNFLDFSDDAELRELSRKYLDLFWATWGQEQIGGVKGGGKARIYQGNYMDEGGSVYGASNQLSQIFWCYTGVGPTPEPHENTLTFLASSYRPAAVVADLGADAAGRGVYTSIERKLGRGQYVPSMILDFTQFFTRYTYVSPDYVLGTFHIPATPQWNWTMISSQNRWHGAIFKSHPDARIYFQCSLPTGEIRNYNQHWSVQSKNAMIVQKLDNSGSESTRLAKYAEAMKVWVSTAGRSNLVERAGWVFASYGSAYAAIKVADGAYTWTNDADLTLPGQWMMLEKEYSPIVLEVARAIEYTNFTAFQDRILSNALSLAGSTLTYQSSLGDVLTLYTNYSALPMVNGVSVNLAPTNAYDSPFVSSVYNSGVVAVQKDARQLTLDFGTQLSATNIWRAGNNVWDTSTRNWNGGAAAWANTGGEQAVFAGPPGTVVLAPGLYPTGLIFNTSTVLAGAPLWLLGPDPFITTTNGVTARLDTSLSGWVGFSKSGPGTLVLGGTNDYLGSTRILSGTLQVGNGGNSGTPGTGVITNSAALVVNRAGTVLFPSGISGPGSFAIQNPAPTDTVVLAASNSFTGSLTLTRGTLRLADSGALGGVARTLTLDTTNTLAQLGGDAPVNLPSSVSFIASGASLVNVSGNNLINGPIALGNPSGATVTSVAGSMTLAGNISGGSSACTLELSGASTGSNLVSSPISDGVQPTSLLKSGSGSWQLGGTQPFTGLTTVAGGTLVVGGSLAGSVNVTNGVLTASGEASVAGNLTIAAGGAFQARPNAAISVNGALNLLGSLAVNFPRGILVGSQFVILRKAGVGAITGTFAGLPEGQTFSAAGYNWSISYKGGDGNDVLLTSLTGPATALEAWRDVNFGYYSNTGVAADSADPDGDGLTNLQEFGLGTDPNDPNSPAAFVWTSLAGGSWTNAANWSPNLAPPGNPVRRLEFFSGVTLLGGTNAITNHFAGTYALNRLTLGGSCATTQRVNLAGGALNFQASGTNAPAILLPATPNPVTYAVANAMTLATNVFITATQGGNAILTGVLSGPGGITFIGSGTNLVLAGNNTYADATHVVSGYYPGTITPFWSTLQIGNGGASGNPGTGPIFNDGTLRFNRSGTLLLTNAISGAGNLVLNNPSSTDTLILSGSNSFIGGVTIMEGRLVISNSLALGINGKTINATTGLGGLELNAGTGSINLDPDIYLTLSGSPSGGALRNVTGNNTINGHIGAALGAGTPLISSDGGSLTLAGPVQTVNSGGRNINFAGTSTGANLVSGPMADGISTLSITKSGSGIWIFSGANTYTGPTTVSAGTLQIQNDTALGATSTNTTTVNTGAKLQLAGTSLNVAENLVLGTGSTGVIVENVIGDNMLSGAITRNGTLTFLATGGKLTILSGIGDTTNLLSLQGNGDGEISGAITAASELEKINAGTWILSGSNTFSAPTTVSGGTLRVNGSLANGAVTVNGGTLAGNGIINGSVVISGGVLEPGASTNLNETLAIRNNLTLGGTARFQIGKSGAIPVSDHVAGVTNITYGGTLIVTNITGATWVGGETFNLFSASSSKTGSFTNLILQPAPAGVTASFNPSSGTLSLAVAPPPLLVGSKVSNGSFQFQIYGEAGHNYAVQASTNLTTWTTLLTTNPPALPFLWRDSNATNYSTRFYRVLLSP